MEGQQIIFECPLCQNPLDQNSIKCTNCQTTYHATCVNATEGDQSNLTFKCGTCVSGQVNNIPPISEDGSRHSRRSNESQSRFIQLELQRLEEERSLQLTLNQQYLEKKYKLLQLQEEERLSATSSQRSQTVRDWLQQLPQSTDQSAIAAETESRRQCQESSNFQANDISNIAQGNKTAPRQVSSHLPNTSIYLNNASECLNTNYTMAPTSNQITTAVPAVPVQNISSVANRLEQSPQILGQSVNVSLADTVANPTAVTSASYIPISGCNTYTSIPRGHTNPRVTQSNSRYPNFSNLTSTQYAIAQNSPMNLPQQPMHTTLPHFSGNFADTTQLNQSQIQARKSIPKELPNFGGQPEDWPLFSSTFEWSTQICGFSDSENLIRLQKSLSGEALKNVQHMLIHPSNVSWVMSILQLLYGQPEKIVNSIKNRIRSTPPVDEKHLPSFTAFAINVKGLIATIESSNLLDEINNSSLLQELIQKIPPSYQLQWGKEKLKLRNENKNPNMYDFANWVFEIGVSASCITVENSYTRSINRDKEHNNSSDKNKRAYVHTHNEERKCFVCSDVGCVAIGSCSKYLSLNRADKWEIVRKHKLCKNCLGRHSGECRKKTQCGVHGCQYYHHSSLHRYSTNDDRNQSAGDTHEEEENQTHAVNNIEMINTHKSFDTQVLFKIIPIKVFGNKNTIDTFAFIDEGSSISLMDETLMDALGMTGMASPLCLRWTGGTERCENNSKLLTVQISGVNNESISLNVRTVASLDLPMQSLDYLDMVKKFPHLKNLPIQSYFDAKPKILIGLNHFNLVTSSKIRRGHQGEPIAVKTQIGWLIYGTMKGDAKASTHFNYQICECSSREVEIEGLVKSFYALDSVGICYKDTLIGKDEERSLMLLKKFTKQRPF